MDADAALAEVKRLEELLEEVGEGVDMDAYEAAEEELRVSQKAAIRPLLERAFDSLHDAMGDLRYANMLMDEEHVARLGAIDGVGWSLRIAARALRDIAECWGHQPKRKAVALETRVLVFRRDGYVCVECGEANPALLTVDHRIPVAFGGTGEPDNLRTLCRGCNSSKGARL